MNSAEILAKAQEARLQGDNKRAIELCRAVLASERGNADAVSLLGVSLAETGAVAEGEIFVARALSAAPQNWRYLLNYSTMLECKGDLAGARDAAEKAVAAAPERFETWGRAGDLAGKCADFARASDALRRALDLAPDHPGLSLLYAGAAYETGDIAAAERALDVFEKAAPGHPQALRLRTFIARQKNDWEGLITAAHAALAAAPEEEGARAALAFAYAQLGHFPKAAEVYRPLAEKTPPQAIHLATLGKYLLSARELDAGAALYRQALDLEPDNSAAAAGYARHLNFIGDFENAAIYARRAIEADPNNAEALAELALASGARLTDAEIAQARRIGANSVAGAKHRAIALFALGDALHQRKDRAGAFGAWTEANRLKQSLGDRDAGGRYRLDAEEAYIDHLIGMFPVDYVGSEAERARRPAPIFIVGMPRSGTTLLDSAISAHRDVSSAGELPYMSFAVSEFLKLPTHGAWRGGALPYDIAQGFREKYVKQYRDYDVADAPYITDKQPSNYYAVGLIRRVFPEARIIYIRRNPVEVCFSMYRRNFSTSWTASNSLEDLAHSYAQHVRVADHWLATLGENIAFIQYEDFVRNFETELRRLIAFCGLDWDPACLEYYKQDRTVLTFSAAQVRKPPSPEHLNSTGPYAEFLAPLMTALEFHGIDLETGARKAGAV